MIKNIIYIFFCLTLLSCEKTIDFNETATKPFMVLNSYINPSEIITVEITKSQSVIKEFKVERITNADVEIFENGVLFEKLSYDGKKECYKSTKKPIIGNTYSINAAASGYNSISSETIIPKKPALTDHIFQEADSEYNNGKMTARIRLKDEANKKNYYRIVVEEGVYYMNGPDDFNQRTFGNNFNKQFEWEGNIMKRWIGLQSKDPVLTGKGQSGNEYLEDVPDNIFGIFNDDLFEGEEYTVEFTFNTYYSEGLQQRVNVYVMSITEDYYLYLKSYSSQTFYDESPFSEPVQIYSNIRNGAGVFGAYNFENIQVYDRIDIK